MPLTHRSHEKFFGMKNYAIIPAIALGILALGFSPRQPAMTNFSLAMQASALGQADAWAVFQKSEEARRAAKSFRSKMISNQNGQPMQVESEVMCPDRHHMKVMQAGQTISEMWAVGDTMYVNTGGHVMKMPSRSNPAPGCPGSEGASGAGRYGDRTSVMEDFMKYKDRSKITKGGISTVEGSPCQKWNIVTTDPQTNKMSNSEYCIGVADNLPRRMSTITPQGNNFEITYWDWNQNISINPPSQ